MVFLPATDTVKAYWIECETSIAERKTGYCGLVPEKGIDTLGKR